MKTVTQAYNTLATLESNKVAFVKEAYNDYIREAAKVDDDLNFIGHPEQCKLDWMTEAVTEGIMTTEEFTRIFSLVGLVERDFSAC